MHLASVPERKVLAAYVLAIVFAGATGVGIRFSVAELPPFWGALLRFVPAAIIFWLIAFFRKTPLPGRAAFSTLLLYGLLQFGVNFALGYWAMQTVEAGLAQIITALTPLFTLFLAYSQGLENFRWRGLIGGLIAAAGITWAFFERPAGANSLLPMLALIASAACIAQGIVLVKRVRSVDPIMINAVAMTVGVLSLAALSLLAREARVLPALPRTWISLAYLVVFSSVLVFYLYAYVIQHWTASAASYSLVLVPFVTVALGAWLAGERLGAGALAGGAVVLIGVWIGALSGAQPRNPASPSNAAASKPD